MKTVLVTGGIGSGKSQVARLIAAAGWPVYDCDSRAKGLYDSVPGLKERAEQATGLPFARLREVFADPQKLRALEDVVHPEVLKDMARWRDSQTSQVVFFESAIAAQKDLFKGFFDETVLVTAPEYVRIRRVMARDGLSREAVIDRVKLKSPFIPHDYQISNVSDLETLRTNVEKYLKTII